MAKMRPRFCKGFESEDRIPLVRHISAHILSGLDSLQRMGIIHNGKMSPSTNLLRGQVQSRTQRLSTTKGKLIPEWSEFIFHNLYLSLTENRSFWKICR